MNAPVPPTASPAATGSNPATASATDVVADDFVLMLGQLLGAPVAQSANPAKSTSTSAANLESEADQAAQDAAAVTGLPMTLMTNLPPNPLTGSSAAGTGKALEMLPIATTSAGSQSAGAAKPAELAATLLDNLSPEDSGAPASSNLSSQNSQPLDLSRPIVAPDPSSMRTVHQPVGSSAWADELGTRMIMMSERGQHSASLRMSPEHLGPLEVRISVRDDQASVWFGASHADTRAAIEQALPRLRELFASQGLSLADAGVHHQSPREQNRTTPSFSQGLSASAETETLASPAAIRLGLVDAYA